MTERDHILQNIKELHYYATNGYYMIQARVNSDVKVGKCRIRFSTNEQHHFNNEVFVLRVQHETGHSVYEFVTDIAGYKEGNLRGQYIKEQL